MASRLIIIVFIILNIFNFTLSVKKQLLSGKWNVRDKENLINISATVPGGIYSDLYSARKISDIYFRFNDVEYRWVANKTWIYNYVFSVNEEVFNAKNIDLVFEGLDTFAKIYLNNNKIGLSDNMFIRYVFDVKPYLHKKNNNLKVIFKSPIAVSNSLHEKYAEKYEIPPLCTPKEYKGECHVNLIRKMQASFGWDWGPAFPSVGIWKPVYLRSYDSAVIQDIIVNITESLVEEEWNINLDIYLETTSKSTQIAGLITTELTTDINVLSIFTQVDSTVNEEFVQHIRFSIPKNHVKLWWPNGFGEQPLYNLKVSFRPDGSDKKSIKEIKIAFRTIELVQNVVDKGLTFYFRVNNLAMFAKGSNWIPANILPEKGANIKEIEYLLQSAKDVHMNMLRVWGGGVYESDEFYNLADKLGILIWQDFMFACSMYPTNKEFLESVNTEVKQQVRRLQHHPSIAIWAGNNENEVALRGNWYGTSKNFSLYKEDYVTLYVDNIKKVCELNDPSRTYLVSSPSNGLESEKEGYIAENPYDTHYGDIHYYNYIADGWNQNIYSRARFSSEYGFQSLPAYETLRTSTNDSSDLKYKSDFLESRQHHLAGYDQIKFLVNRHLIWPNQNTKNYMKTFIYFSQISQAMSYKAQTEYYRQWRSYFDEVGNGLTMGALYWQLNDVWPAPSWSSIDFRQRWKMVHYFAKDFFAPVIVTGNLSPAEQLTVFVISDLMTTIENAVLTTYVFNWGNLKPIYAANKTINILPSYSTRVENYWLDQHLGRVGCGDIKTARSNCFLYFTLKSTDGKLLSPNNFVFPKPLKSVNGLTTPHLSVNIRFFEETDQKLTNFNLTIVTDRIAPFVWLETGDINGRFSENGFLVVTEEKHVSFESYIPVTIAELRKVLKVTSLKNLEHII